MIKTNVKKICALCLAFIMILSTIDMTVFATSMEREIENNGLGGINININEWPYSSKKYAYQGNEYSEYGCTWFATSRAVSLTGITEMIVRTGAKRLSCAAEDGFSVVKEPIENSFICWPAISNGGWGHIAILEKIDGEDAYISEGGWYAGNNSTGYCRIHKISLKELTTKGYGGNGAPIGYVYFGNYLNISIDEKTFPDSEFRRYIEQYDLNKDGILNYEENSNIEEIYITSYESGDNKFKCYKIKDFTGIEKLSNLKKIRYHYKSSDVRVEEIDFRGCRNLEYIHVSPNGAVSNNEICNIKIAGLSNLKSLYAYNVCVDDVTGCSSLRDIHLSGNYYATSDSNFINSFYSIKDQIEILYLFNVSDEAIIIDMPNLLQLDVDKQSLKFVSAPKLNQLHLRTEKGYKISFCDLPSLEYANIMSNSECIDYLKYFNKNCSVSVWDPVTKVIKYNDETVHMANSLGCSNLFTPIYRDIKLEIPKTELNTLLGNTKTDAKIICSYSDNHSEYSFEFKRTGIIWKSSNPKVASVDSNGKIQAHTKGKTTISASFEDPNRECSVLLSKEISVESLYSKIIRTLIKCPVNVEVYDEDGNLEAQIIDNVVEKTSDTVVANVFGDMKEIIILDDKEHSFKYIGTDSGKLDVSVIEYGESNVASWKNIYNIPLTEGCELESKIDINNLDKFGLIASEGTEYKEIENLSLSDVENLSVNVICGSEGVIAGDGNYTKGDIVTLSAIAQDGYSFEGWFDEDGILCSEKELYSFEIINNTSLYAKFKKLPIIDFQLQNLNSFLYEKSYDGNYSFIISPKDVNYSLPEDLQFYDEDNNELLDIDYVYNNESGSCQINSCSLNIIVKAAALQKNEVNTIHIINDVQDFYPDDEYQFSANVDGYGFYSNDVEWRVLGNKDSGTTISNTGLLKISKYEYAPEIYVIVKSKENANIVAAIRVEIKKYDIANAQIDNLEVNYSGNVLSPDVLVKFGDKLLEMNEDYLCDSDNEIKDIGEYSVSILGINKYQGEKQITVTVVPATGVHKQGTHHAAVVATCNSTGNVEYWDCTECGAKLNSNSTVIVDATTTIDSSNHTGETELREKTTATCTSAGYSGDTYCKGCNAKISSGSVIPATGHDWSNNNGICKRNSSHECNHCGATSGTCTICGKNLDTFHGDVTLQDNKEKGIFAGGSLVSSIPDILEAVLTEEDKAVVAAGKKISVWSTISDITNTVSATDKALIEGNLSANYKVGLYLDIMLKKLVEGGSEVTVTELPNGSVKIQFTIPIELQKRGRIYKIIRIHEGVVKVLDADVDSSYNLTFATDAFSTYALVYSDGNNEDQPGNGNKNSETTSPKTGDTNAEKVWWLLALTFIGIVFVIGAFEKRRQTK